MIPAYRNVFLPVFIGSLLLFLSAAPAVLQPCGRHGSAGVTVTKEVPHSKETIPEIMDRERTNPLPARGDTAIRFPQDSPAGERQLREDGMNPRRDFHERRALRPFLRWIVPAVVILLAVAGSGDSAGSGPATSTGARVTKRVPFVRESIDEIRALAPLRSRAVPGDRAIPLASDSAGDPVRPEDAGSPSAEPALAAPFLRLVSRPLGAGARPAASRAWATPRTPKGT